VTPGVPCLHLCAAFVRCALRRFAESYATDGRPLLVRVRARARRVRIEVQKNLGDLRAGGANWGKILGIKGGLPSPLRFHRIYAKASSRCRRSGSSFDSGFVDLGLCAQRLYWVANWEKNSKHQGRVGGFYESRGL
jgi:hypothetical protein